MEIPGNVVRLVPAAVARGYRVVPWREVGETLEVLCGEPPDASLAEDLAFTLNRRVRVVSCEAEELGRLFEQCYGSEARPTALAQAGPRGQELVEGRSGVLPLDESIAMQDQPPIIRLVNQILAQAVRDRASDIHFEPFEREFQIRMRVDGALFNLPSPAREQAPAVISRLKVMADLNIAERRVPQDGRIRSTLAGRAVDLRVSTLPTQFGESVVLRVLDQSAVQLDLAQLGLPAGVLSTVRDVISRPSGLFLVTGPTGSGKTTTLYGGLCAINSADLKVLTIEDPVEYEIEGLMQVPVNPAAGLTFASALRSFLRQDPDVIMVGEIRDLETAQVALQASLTGHLVLSTLHTNDAPAAVTRLLDMGVEPFLLASTVEAVLAQRLLRRICPDCRAEDAPPRGLLAQLDISPAVARCRRFYRGGGCAHCGQSGYRGRMGVFECLVMDESLRELVSHEAPVQSIRQKARETGLRTLRDQALQAAEDGVTTLEEVARHT